MSEAAKQGLVDLLTRIGDDKAIIQSIQHTLTGARLRGKGRKKLNPFTEVSFGTTETTPTDLMNGTGKIGLVVWLDRSDVEAAQAAFRSEQEKR